MQDPITIRPDEDIPSFEPWVIALLCVFIPIVAGFLVPAYMWVCFGIAGALFAAAMVMLVRQERARKKG